MKELAGHSIEDDEFDENRRKSYRMPPLADSQPASITIRSQVYDCEIVDQSAGGFRISSKTLPAKTPLILVELNTGSVCQRMRVVWHERIDDRVYMGLQRLPDDQATTQVRPRSSSTSTWILGTLVFIAVAVLFFCLNEW